MSTLETVSGKFIDVNNIDPSLIDISDIAWSLSRINRCNGHTIPLIPFNVAQHSLFVYKIILRWVEEGSFVYWESDRLSVDFFKTLYLKALLHDAAEYLIGDIPTPIKHSVGIYEPIKMMEDNIDFAIEVKYNISFDDVTANPEHYYKQIKKADLYSRKIEAYHFMNSRGKDWLDMPDVSLVEIQSFEEAKTSLESYEEFMKTFFTIYGE